MMAIITILIIIVTIVIHFFTNKIMYRFIKWLNLPSFVWWLIFVVCLVFGYIDYKKNNNYYKHLTQEKKITLEYENNN